MRVLSHTPNVLHNNEMRKKVHLSRYVRSQARANRFPLGRVRMVNGHYGCFRYEVGGDSYTGSSATGVPARSRYAAGTCRDP